MAHGGLPCVLSRGRRSAVLSGMSHAANPASIEVGDDRAGVVDSTISTLIQIRDIKQSEIQRSKIIDTAYLPK